MRQLGVRLCKHLATHRAAASEAQGWRPLGSTATLCARGCNPTCSGLQPYVLEAATLRARGCNPTWHLLPCGGSPLDAARVGRYEDVHGIEPLSDRVVRARANLRA